MTPEEARADMVTGLVGCGVLPEPWRQAFGEVPRHLFIPEVIWRVDRRAGGRLRPVRRQDGPDRWLELAYRDAPVDTQVDDGRPGPDGGWEVTSSASQPSVVASMLAALDPRPGERVLEIGTGTGWNAALLAYRFGPENVVTIEVDPQVARDARRSLDAAGYGKVTVITGDGVLGWPSGAPFDRLIATAGATAVPWPWVAQTRPGGRLVVPLSNTYAAPGMVSLVVDQDGGAAEGHIGGPAVFMGLRAQRVARPNSESFTAEPDWVGDTDLHPYQWAGDRAAAVAVGQRLAGGVHTVYGGNAQWLYHPDSGSWASVETEPGPPYRVEQAGPLRLMDQVDLAYRWWTGAGSPGIDQWRVRVDQHGQRMDLSVRDAPN